MERTDVVVIGGGPAGACAATLLARGGRQVTLVDKARFPRDKCCGDGLTTGALRRLERLGLDPANIPSWRVVTDTVWRSPSGHTIRLQVPEGDGTRIAVARRSDLDIALVDLARKAGVTVLEGEAVTDVRSDKHQVTVETENGNAINAPFVIAADGMWSPTRRFLSNEVKPESRYLGEIHAFRQYFRNVTGPARDQLYVTFERDLLPGYFWSFPVGDNSVNIGFGIVRDEGRTVQWMNAAWKDLLQRPHIREALGDAEPEGPHRAWPIPARIDLDLLAAANSRVLFVGDAARVVDPLTGEGIGQALETAELAARAIMQNTEPEKASRSYRNAIRFGMAIDNTFARSLAGLVKHEAGARAVIRMAPKGPWKGRYALRWVFEDNPRAALLTPWRWSERFRTKSGAYVS